MKFSMPSPSLSCYSHSNNGMKSSSPSPMANLTGTAAPQIPAALASLTSPSPKTTQKDTSPRGLPPCTTSLARSASALKKPSFSGSITGSMRHPSTIPPAVQAPCAASTSTAQTSTLSIDPASKTSRPMSTSAPSSKLPPSSDSKPIPFSTRAATSPTARRTGSSASPPQKKLANSKPSPTPHNSGTASTLSSSPKAKSSAPSLNRTERRRGEDQRWGARSETAPPQRKTPHIKRSTLEKTRDPKFRIPGSEITRAAIGPANSRPNSPPSRAGHFSTHLPPQRSHRFAPERFFSNSPAAQAHRREGEITGFL